MLKRITIALGLLSCSAAALAGMPGNSLAAPMPTGVALEAPDSISAWSFGIEALYVQPTESDFQYIQPGNAGINANQSVEPGYSWGGEADITYHFEGSSRDVSLAYTHLDTSDSDSTASTSNEVYGAKAKEENDYNAVDLTFGQQLLVGNRLVLRPFAGLRYAGIDTDDKAFYSNPLTNYTATLDERIDSDFQGVGPRAGIDIRVLSNCGFSLVGTFGGALLVGENDSHLSIAPSAAAGGTPTKWNNDDSTEVVPELDGRIGLDYTPHQFFPAGSMGFQIGYEVVHYFNVSNLDTLDTIATNSVNNLSDFSYQGPYLRLQLNIA